MVIGVWLWEEHELPRVLGVLKIQNVGNVGESRAH